ncbi:MAG: winged helix-turn-helix transcriptional regulator [Nitrososphaerota archaeon]|nr:winged helix-turn-helix transcriptional regulator [Nitrososphaerota archaeon]
MGDSEDPMGINDKIEILSTDDERIKAVGELLSSDSSRTILKLLFNEEMTANQISQKTEISLPLVMYHLKKMQDCNVVKISQTGKNTKSHDMKYYTVDKFAIVILPSGMSEKAKSSKSLFNSFNRIYRFATIGGVSLAAWFSAQFIQQNNRIALSNARANSGNQFNAPESAFTATGPEMAMKSAPVEETQREVESTESAPAHDVTEQKVPEEPNIESQSAEDLADQSQYAAPPEPTMPMDGDTFSYITPTDAPILGEPMSDFYLSIIIALSVGIIGLIIERIIRARRK